jgi:hypothetical protein
MALKIPNKNPKGLGDTIENFTTITGIKSLADFTTGLVKKDCGCNKRKETLNKVFPYKK